MSYPKYKVLRYFTEREVVIEGGLLTPLFSDDHLNEVDEFVSEYKVGVIIPKQYQGGPNWFYEFCKFLESKGITPKFK